MKKYINDFTNNIKKMFTKSEPGGEKDKVTGRTFKEKFSNIGDRMKKTGSPVRTGFFATYETLWNVILFVILTVSLLGLLVFSVGLGYFAALVNDEEIQSNEELEVALTEMTERDRKS